MIDYSDGKGVAMAKATIADIAREAQVSVTTVSRFINGNYGKMSAATKSRIQETVDRLDYRPNASARRMRQQNTHVVGVVVADISNVFSSLLFKGIDEELRPAGYDVMLMNSDNSLEEERAEINRLLSQRVDGLVIQPNASDFNAYSSIITARTPLVVVDREPENLPDSVSRVMSDNEDSCMRLGKRLVDAGYDNVLVLSRMKSEISAQTHRVEGLRKAADESGILMIAIDVKDNDVDWIEQKLSIALGHLSGRTAIVSLMGPLLFDVLAVLRALGIGFPDGVGLVSFDDWRWSQYVHDGIYLLEQDPREMGRAAAHDLLLQIRAKENGIPYEGDGSVVLPVSFVSARSLVGPGLGLTERVGVAGNAHGRIVQGSDGLHLIRIQLESEDIQVLSHAFSVSMCR